MLKDVLKSSRISSFSMVLSTLCVAVHIVFKCLISAICALNGCMPVTILRQLAISVMTRRIMRWRSIIISLICHLPFRNTCASAQFARGPRRRHSPILTCASCQLLAGCSGGLPDIGYPVFRNPSAVMMAILLSFTGFSSGLLSLHAPRG